MASVFIVNSYQINFESVLMIPDHDGMLNMFKALEASGLQGFLGCESVLYEKELEQFFDTALVQGDDITGDISGKYFSISQDRFAQIFELPTEGLVNFYEVPKDRVYDARSIFSQKGVQVEIHGKKKYMKYEFRLLNDILANAVNVKASSFDDVTTERFQMMTAIHFGLKVNWSKVLFNVLKDMVDKSQKKAKGFAAQIGILLKSMPAITMGDGVPFPNAKILSMKTVNTYIATNITIDARGENVEPGLAKVAVVKRTPKSKKKSSSTDETPVEVISEISGSKKRQATEGNAPAIPKKRRTMKNKPSPSQSSLDIVNVTQDVVPLQIIDPTPAAAAVNSPVPKRKSRKRRLVLPTGSDDETMGTQELVKDTDEAAVKPTDEVDIIIEQVLEETLKLGVSENSKPVTEEDMSIDDLLLQISNDMLLPSITATEITKIRLGESISINEVRECDVYLASLPRISIHDKGKAILEEDEPVRGNPAHEMVELICGDIEFLVRLRDQVMVDVVEFFHSFSLNKLSNLDALRELKEKEKLMLEWAETDSLEMAVKRKAYILDNLPVEQPCASTMFDSSIGSGAVLARFYSVAKSTCWSDLEIDSDFEESYSDAPTIYRSPSPFLQEADPFSLGPAILSGVAQEEQLYYVESPESPPPLPQREESSSSSWDSQMNFDSTDIPLDATTEAQTSIPAAPVDSIALSDVLSRLRTVEHGLQDTLGHQNDYFRSLIQSARLEGKNNDDLLILRINELKKTVMAQGVTTATDSLAFKSRFNALDAKLILLDRQVAAIRSEQLEFQAKIAADLLSLSTQIGDLVDYIRGDDAKNGEGSSSRPQPTPDDQGRGGGDTGGGSGGVRTTTIMDRLSLEEVAERIRETDRQRSNVDLERERNRERRERRLSRRGPSKRRRY
ncbi:dystroglycan-like [Dorcoceras hygrometricum]|uniref:Dystroglycan-like n=1 Tax=Dorcoceras hygrometricum TaxID=472368 RepID=A0A2Z7BDW4_9LAMI|nr:dystroglycan-like [Dorcoceras hygrometricum]